MENGIKSTIVRSQILTMLITKFAVRLDFDPVCALSGPRKLYDIRINIILPAYSQPSTWPLGN